MRLAKRRSLLTAVVLLVLLGYGLRAYAQERHDLPPFDLSKVQTLPSEKRLDHEGADHDAGIVLASVATEPAKLLSPRRFSREILEGECFHLPYGVEETTFRECIAESARMFLPPFDPQHPENFGREYDPAKYVACMQASPMRFHRYRLRNGSMFQSIEVRNYGECSKYRRLKPQEPEVWPTAGRPVWPDLPDGRRYDPPSLDMEDKRQLHTQSIRYFERLCKDEAKETILRTVDDVDGVYFIRPNVAIKASEYLEPHLIEYIYGIGDMLGSLAPFRPATAPDFERHPGWYVERLGISSAMDALITPEIIWPRRPGPYNPNSPPPPFQASEFSFGAAYEYVEFPRWDALPGDSRPLMRATRNPKLDLVMKLDLGTMKPQWVNRGPVFEPVTQPKARYGVTWRSFEPSPGDRSLGIYGNEHLIVDLATNEVMAYLRTFIFSGQPTGEYGKYWVQRGGWLDGAAYCRPPLSVGSLLKRVVKPRNSFRIGANQP